MGIMEKNTENRNENLKNVLLLIW